MTLGAGLNTVDYRVDLVVTAEVLVPKAFECNAELADITLLDLFAARNGVVDADYTAPLARLAAMLGQARARCALRSLI
jgi:hypothetical protein